MIFPGAPEVPSVIAPGVHFKMPSWIHLSAPSGIPSGLVCRIPPGVLSAFILLEFFLKFDMVFSDVHQMLFFLWNS